MSEHSHDQPSSASHSNPFLFAIFLTGGFFVVELLSSYYSGSLALLSDASHMLVDLGALLLGALSHWYMHRPRTKSATFGYFRVEVLGCVLNSIFIWVLVVYLLFESWYRIHNPQEVKGDVVTLVGILGLIVNWVSLKRLHKHSHEGMHVDAAALHVFFDLLGSVGAIITGVVIYLTGWVLIDPFMTLLTCVLVVSSSWKIFSSSIEILLEKVPSSILIENVQGDLEQIQGVKTVHDLHIWRISSNQVMLTAHLGVDAFSPLVSTILSDAQNILKEKHQILHSTLQLELVENTCHPC